MMSRDDMLRAAASALFGPGRPVRVLVVEDNPDLSRLMALILKHCGFEVRTLPDGRLAVATSLAFRPHFILLDIGLPVMDGYEVARRIRDDPSLRDVTIIAISAYEPGASPEEETRARFDHRLRKPVEIRDLLPLLTPR